MSGPLALHWRAVSSGSRGTSFETHLEQLRALPGDRKVRLHQAGDFESPSHVLATASALENRMAFTYSHHRSSEFLVSFGVANSTRGLTINLSANGPVDADTLLELGIGPVVTTLPEHAPKVTHTPNGARVVVCPAQEREGVTCNTCGNGTPLCARRDRDYVVGFRAHGTGKNRIPQGG